MLAQKDKDRVFVPNAMDVLGRAASVHLAQHL